MREYYEALRVAILRRAIIDYIHALRKRNFAQIKTLERFFLGEWGQMLSYDHGEYIIEKCKKISSKDRTFCKLIDK